MKFKITFLLMIFLGLVIAFPMVAFSEEANNSKQEKKPQGAQQQKPQGAQQHGGKAAQAPSHVSTSSGPSPRAVSASHQSNASHSSQITSGSTTTSHQNHISPSVSPVTQQGASTRYSRQNQSIASTVSSQNIQQRSRGNRSQSSLSSTATPSTQAVQQGSRGRYNHQTQSSGTAAVVPSYQGNNQSGGSQQYQGQSTPNGQYNSGNNYGGLWSAGNSHGDWNQNQQYSWNNHQYRWWQGGWLIIDAGFNPFYVHSGNYFNPAMISNVQQSLANQGYYQGPIDGDFGPATRNAVGNYQNDHNLMVSGRINNDLLRSLQLQ